MIELGVNIDHVATVRQARRTWEPDPVWAAVEAHLGGADGITVHLREDRRHIQDDDVRRLRELAAGAALDETLRRFEWQLLREAGYAPDLEHDAENRPIDEHGAYRWRPGSGFVAAEPAEIGAGQPGAGHPGAGHPGAGHIGAGQPGAGQPGMVSGTTLRELAEGRFASVAGRQQAKYLMRAILAHHLDGAPLNTRQILIDLHKL